MDLMTLRNLVDLAYKDFENIQRMICIRYDICFMCVCYMVGHMNRITHASTQVANKIIKKICVREYRLGTHYYEFCVTVIVLAHIDRNM